MKKRYIVAIAVIVLFMGYLIGQFVPWDLLHPSIKDKEISMNDYYTRLVSIIGAVATIFATLIALFKEDIRKFYENASLHVNFKDQLALGEVLNKESTTSSSQGIEATKYEIVLCVQNKGKLAARGCQVYLEEIKFKHSSFPSPKQLGAFATPVEWIGKNDSSAIIPSTGKSYINILEILPPLSGIVAPDSQSPNKSISKLKIGGADFNVDDYNGNYNCSFVIYSENSNPVKFSLEIIWNGVWHPRLAEMKDCITITHVKE